MFLECFIGNHILDANFMRKTKKVILSTYGSNYGQLRIFVKLSYLFVTKSCSKIKEELKK